LLGTNTIGEKVLGGITIVLAKVVDVDGRRGGRNGIVKLVVKAFSRRRGLRSGR
jgi:hypothetical protein